MKVDLVSLNVVEVCTEKRLEGRREQRDLKTKSGHGRYEEMVEADPFGIVYEVENNPAFDDNLELESKLFVDSE